MPRIFVRVRRNANKGSKRPRFAVVAVQGADLRVYRPHVRRGELEALAAALEAEIVYLPGSEGDRVYNEKPEKGKKANKTADH